MGNICCEEEAESARGRREIVPAHYRSVGEYERARTQQEEHVEMQKTLLKDFSTAVIRLKRDAVDRRSRMYRGVYTHDSISGDDVSEYFAATLVEENEEFRACVVKKVRKERVVTDLAKRSIAIEYLVTSFHRSPFIVKNLTYYENYSFLCLYFDLSRYVHLSAFTYNPQYYTYFRSNLEQHIRFVLAGIILALQELHSLHIVYRGINSENIVITENGYPLATNLAALHPEGQLAPLVLASPFVSPEEFNNQPVGRAADFWALGVLAFHMITGNYPSFGTYQEGQFNPFGISSQLTDLVNRLLRFDPAQRLGVRNIADLKGHVFFYAFDWHRYAAQELPSPFSSQRPDYPKRAAVEQQYDYHEKENFDSSYSFGGAMMAGLLFVELGSLLMISNMYERQHLYEEHALPTEEAPAQLSNEFQEGCALQLSDGSNGTPEDGGVGGDYD